MQKKVLTTFSLVVFSLLMINSFYAKQPQYFLEVDGQSLAIVIDEVSQQYQSFGELSNLTFYKGSVVSSESSWIRLSRVSSTLYGLAGVNGRIYSIEQTLPSSTLPNTIRTQTGPLSQPIFNQMMASTAIANDAIEISMLPGFTIDDASLGNRLSLINNPTVNNEGQEDQPRIINIEYIFDPLIIAERGNTEVERTLAASNIMSGFYESQVNLVINVAALHFPSTDDIPINNSSQAPSIVSDITNARINSSLNIFDDSIALFITNRPISSSPVNVHNGYAILDGYCTAAGNTVVSDRVIQGAVGGPLFPPNSPLDLFYLVEIFAHEIGHIIGGRHTSCGAEGGIMSTFFDFAPRDHFSSCSINMFNNFVNTFGSCALDYPPVVSGIDGSWFDLTHDGEGFQIEILDETRALLAWYTFDSDGNQRWISGVGELQGNRIVVNELTVASGPIFGETFDPADVVREVWGNAIVTFDSCDSGLISYVEQATGTPGVQTLSRLTSLSGVSCSNDETTQISSAEAIGLNTSGTWFDPMHDGEGLIIEQLSESRIVFSWFSYDDVGDQAWFIGIAEQQEDGQYLADQVTITDGGLFGADFDPATVERIDWGSLRLTFADCENVLLEYDSLLPEYGLGSQNLTRLSTPLGTTCED